MSRTTADLREIVSTVHIYDESRCCVSGDVVEVPETDGSGEDLQNLLTSALYQRLYCRPSRAPTIFDVDPRAIRVFVEDLSSANCGTGTWDPGWIVTAVEDDGTLIVYRRPDDLTLWAAPQQFRSVDGVAGVGTIGRLALGKELREMLPGFYMALGDADQPTGYSHQPAGLVRFYWHLTSAAAPVWIKELSRAFNKAGVAFRAKVHSSPASYFRADAGVLYVARTDLKAVMALLPDIHLVVSDMLRPTTPMFTKRLAPGLAVAEDPGDGRSFGQHRCELVAQALVQAFREGRTAFGDLLDSIALRFADEGLVASQPWLSPGSKVRYSWPSRRSLQATSTGS